MRSGLVSVVVAGLILSVVAGCGFVPGSGRQIPAATPDGGAGEIERAIAFRTEFGLPADRAWVEQVAADPNANHEWGVPLTEEEAQQLMERPGSGDDDFTGALSAYCSEAADTCGGLYIDQQAGGQVVISFTRDVEAHRSAIEAIVGSDAPLRIRQVRWSEAELNELQNTVLQDEGFLATIQAAFQWSSTDVIGNRVEVGISSANPEAVAILTQRWGGPDKVRVESDGTGVALRPTGALRGRLLGVAPERIQLLDIQYEPQEPIGARTAIGIGIEPDGSFVIEDLPPVEYRISVWGRRPNSDERVELAAGMVTIPAGGEATLELVVPFGP